MQGVLKVDFLTKNEYLF